jgi:gas vesicle protein
MANKSWPQVLSAFSIGIGVGAILGLIFAPQAGEDTRAYIREKAEDGVDEAIARGRKVARHAQRAVGEAREFVNEAVDAGENAFRQALNS